MAEAATIVIIPLVFTEVANGDNGDDRAGIGAGSCAGVDGAGVDGAGVDGAGVDGAGSCAGVDGAGAGVCSGGFSGGFVAFCAEAA